MTRYCSSPIEFSVRYAYDGVGRLAGEAALCPLDEYWNNYVNFAMGHSYRQGSDLLGETRGVYDWSLGGEYVPPVSRVIAHEPLRDLVSAVSNFSGGAPVATYSYANDELGRRTARADFAAGEPPVEEFSSFMYNERSEVVSAAMGLYDFAYEYDPIGNRTWSLTAFGGGQPDETAYSANALNQYSNITYQSNSLQPDSLSPAYDLDGNMLTNGPWAYAWDAENRLVSATSNDVLRVVNTYDHQSRRIRKEVYARSNPTSNYEPVTCNTFLYDGWNVIRETALLNSLTPPIALTNYYTWGLDLSGTMQGAGGVGGLLAVTSITSQPGTSPTLATFYPCYDANGNIVQYLDQTGGVAVAWAYDAFGNTVSETWTAAPGAVYLPHRFSTKCLDPETGLYYYGYRFYHPELGRWVSRDPMEEGGGLNVYMMVGNSNVSGFDLLGLSSSFIPNSGCSKCSFADIERVSAEYLNIANEKTSHAGPIFRNKYTLWQEFGARICCDPERKEVFSAGIIDGIIDFENGVPVMYVPFKNSPRTCESARAKAYEVARIHSHPPNSPVLSEQDMSNNWIYMVTQQGGVSRFFRSRRGKTDDGKNVIEKCERIKGEWVCNIIPL